MVIDFRMVRADMFPMEFEAMASRKGLILDEIANLLGKVSENESDGGGLSCSNLDSDEDIRLSESDCEESEESAD
ncbi:hypothetical protein TNCV_4074711 [Trichonephila clavipes]|nr:hypothetical protein TNCV_4074711 [Trichonephila clavipes]